MVKISVVCPTYNSAQFIESTLETVVSQTRLPDEVVISDDGSRDNTLAVVERFVAARGKGIAWRILRNEHRGPGATRNAGQLITKVTLYYNKTRQAAITKELMDIVGGAEALK